MATSSTDQSNDQSELSELARCLRQEKLYVSYEKKQLQQLNENLASTGRRLAQTAWTTHQQRDNLECLVMSRGPNSSPQHSCQRANLLHQTQFTDAYKLLSHHMVSYSEFLSALRTNPNLVAVSLGAGDRLSLSYMPDIVSAVFSSLLGSCLLPEDEKLMMTLLHKLVEIQLLSSANPRKLLRHGTSSFSMLYKAFTDQLFGARLFLTSALYEPILSLLTDDEIFLDIDPAKAVIRFPPHERLRRFGAEDSPEHAKKLADHRQHIIKKLVAHANRFVLGIKDSFHCLPSFLSDLIRTIFTSTKDAGMEAKEIWAICADVLFNSFICPAIVDPEPKGIIDMPISYIARFNLMQVAQILQVLALWKWEEINPQHGDLYSLLDRNVVPGLMEQLMKEKAGESDASNVTTGTSRMAVLITPDQLQQMTEWLRAVRDDNSEVGPELTNLLASLPPSVPGRRKVTPKVVEQETEQPVQDGGDKEMNFGQRQKTALAAKLSGKNRHSQGGKVVNENLDQSVPDKVLVVPITDSPSEMPGLASEEVVLAKSRETGSEPVRESSNNYPPREGSLTSASGEVQEKRTRFSLSHDEGSIGNTSDNLEAISEAASNHSVASSLEDEVDQVEDPIIDNLSDMVSANVSGRGTPNVSGRDTPSSQVTEGEEEGRPGPDGEEQEIDEPDLDEAGAAANNNMLNGNRKNPQQDMEEKFGRFEIKPEVRRGRIGQLGGVGGREGERDEAVSMVSDTWSTDVLSSDTETVGEPPTLEDLLRGRPGDEFSTRQRMLDQLQVPGGDGGERGHERGHGPSGGPSHLLDVAETGSEAWSMDVLASDSESFRLGDFDPDDSVSVARSDDTRFTDEIARSDPEHINLVEFGAEVRREADRLGPHQHSFHPIKSAAVEQWAELSRARNGPPVPGTKRRDSDGSAYSSRHESILKKPVVPVSVEPVNSNVCLDEDAVTDGGGSSDPLASGDMSSLSGASVVRLSTTSIASSASSNGSVEVVGPSNKSRSNSSASAGTSAGGSVHGVVPEAGAVVTPGPSPASTGAIPKSISFDKSADKEPDEASIHDHKHLVGGPSKQNRFNFKSWKLPKIGRRGGGGRGSKPDDYHRSTDRLLADAAFNIPEHAEGPVLRRASSDETKTSGAGINQETTDDILAKYRKKTPATAEDKPEREQRNISGGQEVEEVSIPLMEIDQDNLEGSYVFRDAKRKLRLVLSEVELPVVNNNAGDCELISLLTVMLAQAINQQDRSAAAQLRETLRCVSLFDQEIRVKLVRSLLEEYRRRSPYVAYLVRSRQGLLSSLAKLDRLTSRMETEQRMCSKFLISVCVRLFLERREDELAQLLAQFSGTNLMDEKTELLVQFLNRLWNILEQEPMLAATNEEQRTEARKAVERAIFSQIYMAALYPNQEADASRDAVLHQHVARLSEVVTPNHRDLKIPVRYQYECPWPAAQAELRRLAAFKMPSDKVHCVSRVSSIIMNLLSLAQDKSVPAADDFVPVLVFVIIKANPPHLMSTVQMVDNFYRDRLCGEECYWWMQFVGAVEFIKTMDYDIQ